MRQVSFVATSGGDGECFRWGDLSKEDKIAVVGESEYEDTIVLYRGTPSEYNDVPEGEEFDEEDERMLQADLKTLYPDTLMNALGVQEGRKYRFTISVEEVS